MNPITYIVIAIWGILRAVTGGGLERVVWVVLALVVLAAAAAVGDEVDILIDFEDSTAGTDLTTAILDAGSAVFPTGNVWRLNGGTAANQQVYGANRAFLGTVTSGGQSYDGAGSRCYGNVAPSGKFHYAEITLPEDKAAVSLGFWFYAQENYEFNSTDVINLDSNGDFIVLSWQDDTAHLHVATQPDTAGIQLTWGNWYWVTMYGDNTDAKMRIYDTAGAEVGTEQTQPHSSAFYRIYFGRCDGHAGARANQILVDNLVVDYTDATFPLGVTAAPGESNARGARGGARRAVLSGF